MLIVFNLNLTHVVITITLLFLDIVLCVLISKEQYIFLW